MRSALSRRLPGEVGRRQKAVDGRRGRKCSRMARICFRPLPTSFCLLLMDYSRRCWFTFPTRTQVEQPIIWQMSRKFPNVTFDIRQASVQNEIGIMAVLLTGSEAEVIAAMEFLRSRGVTVEPIEKSVVEG